MNRAKRIKYIVIHCTAGFGDVESIQKFWRETLKWKNPGYHVVIDEDGTINYLHPFDKNSNGVKGYNGECLHISYIGGVEKKNYKKAKDTRTGHQKTSIDAVIREMLEWLETNGNKNACDEVMILGHRDFSPDVNNDNLIHSWERIKECPSFDAIPEYRWMFNGDIQHKLPYNR